MWKKQKNQRIIPPTYSSFWLLCSQKGFAHSLFLFVLLEPFSCVETNTINLLLPVMYNYTSVQTEYLDQKCSRRRESESVCVCVSMMAPILNNEPKPRSQTSKGGVISWSNQQPSWSNQQTSWSNQQPSWSNQQPSWSNQQLYNIRNLVITFSIVLTNK